MQITFLEIVTYLLAIVIFALIILYAILQFYQKRITDRMEKIENNHAILSWQRENLENGVIQATNHLLSSTLRFGDVNNLILSSSSLSLGVSNEVLSQRFFQELGIDIPEAKVSEGHITCLMPFNTRYKKIYETIHMACSDSGFHCHRSDESDEPTTNVLRYILELILKSQLIIAVLDGRNANVFYEIGICHAIGKSVILLNSAGKIADLPFNISGNRLLLYNDNKDLKNKLVKVLKSLHHDIR